MAINERLIDTEVAAAGNGGAVNEAEQGLILHLDANDVDSYDGDGSVWYDISEYDVTIPLSDNADDLELHLNASDATSYSGTGTTWTDISGNSRNASFQNMTASDFDKDIGGYFDFAGGTQYMTVPHDTTLDASSDNWTFEAWVNKDVTSGLYIASKSTTSSGSYGWRLQYSGTSAGYQLFAYNTSNTRTTINTGDSGGATDTGKWHHIAFTWDGTNWKSYFNGEHRNTSSMSGTMSSNTDNLEIGRDGYSNNNEYNGKIGAVRIYSKALSASEIGQNYRHSRDYVYTDLINDTNLKLHFDAADLTSASNTTWTDKASSVVLTKSGAVDYDDELGDFIDFGGGYYGNDNTQTPIKDSNGDFSIEFWYNFDAFSGNNVPIGIMQSSSFRGVFVYFGGSTMDVYNYKAGSHSASQFTSQTFSTLGISVGEWYHITHVIDASTDIKTYVNGELKATSTSNAGGTSWTSMNGIRIGDMQTISYSNDGKMGQARVYSSLLTQDQIRQNYNFTKNSYPNGNNCDLLGGIESSFNPTDGSFDITGNGDGITTQKVVPINPANGMTVEMWFKLDADNFNYLFSFDGTDTTYMGLSYRGNLDKIVWFYRTGSAALDSLYTPTIVLNQWHHLVATTDGSSGELYFNGELSESSTSAPYSRAYNEDLHFGNMYDLAQNNNTQISMIKFYDSGLTGERVTSNYNNTKENFGY